MPWTTYPSRGQPQGPTAGLRCRVPSPSRASWEANRRSVRKEGVRDVQGPPHVSHSEGSRVSSPTPLSQQAPHCPSALHRACALGSLCPVPPGTQPDPSALQPKALTPGESCFLRARRAGLPHPPEPAELHPAAPTGPSRMAPHLLLAAAPPVRIIIFLLKVREGTEQRWKLCSACPQIPGCYLSETDLKILPCALDHVSVQVTSAQTCY